MYQSNQLVAQNYDFQGIKINRGNSAEGWSISRPFGDIPFGGGWPSGNLYVSRYESNGTSNYHLQIIINSASNGIRTVYNEPRRSSRYHPFSSSNRRYSRCRMYDCYTCWKKFPTKADMWAHKDEAHKRTFYCRICHKAYPSLRTVKEHQSTHDDHSCQHCPETFRFKDSLAAHLREAHKQKSSQSLGDGVVDKPTYFTTPVASSTPGRPNDQNQQAEDTGLKTFKCPRCIKTFDSALKLECHVKIHTNEEADNLQGRSSSEKFFCPYCVKHFSNKRQLSLHMNSAHTATYYCAKCPAEFESQAELNTHSRNHVVLA